MNRKSRATFRAVVLGIAVSVATAGAVAAQDLNAVVSTWEDKLDARIGVMLRDLSSDWEITHRADERFPMSSTFKPLLCGAILARVDAGNESLSSQVSYKQDGLVTYSPVTELHIETGMSVADLCEATITISDNTAGNLLLERVGGPEGLTEFLRGLGDATTRLDRWETELNEAVPGDPRDTTTPRAMLATLQELLFGEVLEPHSAAQLRQWMVEDQVADTLIRAHLPDGWEIGDKSGAGGHGSRGIIAFLSTPDGETYLAAIYQTESQADFPLRNDVLSGIGEAVIAEIQER